MDDQKEIKKDEVVLTIEKMADGGEGLARHEGVVWFVPGTFRGDVVSAVPREIKKNYRRGEVVSILEPSPHRVEPFCPLAGRCGACPWQGLDYQQQWEEKKTLFFEVMKRFGPAGAGNLSLTGEYLSPERGYRNRLQVHREGSRVGMKGAASHELVPLDHCPILLESLNRALLQGVPESVTGSHPSLLGDRGKALWGSQEVPGEITLQAADREIKAAPGGFFQSHLAGTEYLLGQLVSRLSGKRLVDLYCGVGLFGAFFEKAFEERLGLESSAVTAALAAHNWDVPCREPAPRSPASGSRIIQGAVEKSLGRGVHPRRGDVWLVDPPRKGLSRRVTDFLKDHPPEILVYVSCRPITQARDLARLGDRYRLREAFLMDFYPHTPHAESCLILEAKGRR